MRLALFFDSETCFAASRARKDLPGGFSGAGQGLERNERLNSSAADSAYSGQNVLVPIGPKLAKSTVQINTTLKTTLYFDLG